LHKRYENIKKCMNKLIYYSTGQPGFFNVYSFAFSGGDSKDAGKINLRKMETIIHLIP